MFLGVFLNFATAWLIKLMYVSRFHSVDIFHLALSLAEFLLVALAVYFVPYEPVHLGGLQSEHRSLLGSQQQGGGGGGGGDGDDGGRHRHRWLAGADSSYSSYSSSYSSSSPYSSYASSYSSSYSSYSSQGTSNDDRLEMTPSDAFDDHHICEWWI